MGSAGAGLGEARAALGLTPKLTRRGSIAIYSHDAMILCMAIFCHAESIKINGLRLFVVGFRKPENNLKGVWNLGFGEITVISYPPPNGKTWQNAATASPATAAQPVDF